MSTPQPQQHQLKPSIPIPYSEIIRISLIQRDTREKSQLNLIEYSQKLSNQLIILKSRNNSFLRASNIVPTTSGGGGGGGTVGSSGNGNIE